MRVEDCFPSFLEEAKRRGRRDDAYEETKEEGHTQCKNQPGNGCSPSMTKRRSGRSSKSTVGPSRATKGEGVVAHEDSPYHKAEQRALQGHRRDRKRLLPGPRPSSARRRLLEGYLQGHGGQARGAAYGREDRLLHALADRVLSGNLGRADAPVVSRVLNVKVWTEPREA